MIVNDLSNEELAKIFAHYIFRNTEVVNYHADVVPMNDALYESVSRIVSANLARIARHHGKLAAMEESEFQNAVDKMRPSRAAEFLRYAQAMDYYIIYKPGACWDAPRLISARPEGDLTAYLLGGAFRDCCNRCCFFDDNAMRRVNRDIHNRIYTLICTGVLPPKPRRSAKK